MQFWIISIQSYDFTKNWFHKIFPKLKKRKHFDGIFFFTVFALFSRKIDFFSEIGIKTPKTTLTNLTVIEILGFGIGKL